MSLKTWRLETLKTGPKTLRRVLEILTLGLKAWWRRLKTGIKNLEDMIQGLGIGVEDLVN